MRAIVWKGPRQMAINEIPAPKPGAGDVLIKVHSAGICGSELSGYLGESSLRVPPLIMGHEFTGTVVQSQDRDASIKPGDGVVVNPLITCEACTLCSQGLQNLCQHRKLVGVHIPGAFAEYVVVPARNCLAIPATATSLLANSVAEPLACSLRAVRAGGVQPGSRVLVLGAGAIGLLSIVAVQEVGGRVVLTSEINPGRLAIAQDWGSENACNPLEEDPAAFCRGITDGLGVDVVLDAVGSTTTRQTAIRAVRPGGKVVWIGLHTAESPVPGNHIVRSEIQVTGSFAYTPVDFKGAVDLLAAGKASAKGAWLEERALETCEASFAELIDHPPTTAKIILHP